MTEEDFWSTTPRAFFNAVEGFESLRRADLEIQRYQTFRIVGSWVKIRRPQDLFRFGWETKIISDNERALAQRKAQYLSRKFDRIEKRHGGQDSGVII